MFPVIFEGLRQAGPQRHLRAPSEGSLNLPEVAVVIADINGLKSGREWNDLVLSTVVQTNEQLCPPPPGHLLFVTQVEHLPFRCPFRPAPPACPNPLAH